MAKRTTTTAPIPPVTVVPAHVASATVRIILECSVRDLTVRTADDGRKYVNLPYVLKGRAEGLKGVSVTLKRGNLTIAKGEDKSPATATPTVDPDLIDLVG